MARKFGRKNQVKVDPFNYSLMMLGEPKIGKTSLLYEVAEKLVGEDGYNQTSEAWESDKQTVKDVYEVYEPAIDKAKEKAKDTYESAKDKVSSWYQGFKEGN
jgi:KaiC/GvpD/RAD55 family RecA-like ATPase